MGTATNLYEELKRLADKTNVRVRIGKNHRVVILSGSDKLDFHPRAAQAFLRARFRAAQSTSQRGRGRLPRGALDVR